METKNYQLKVTLRYTRPPIWRRLEVRGDTTLERLHDTLQIAMGWTDSHLHQFVAKGVIYGAPDHDWGQQIEDEAVVRLDQILRRPKAKLLYEYDFGDSWQHEVVLEKLLPLDPECHAGGALVTGGRRACPPEDCGGVGGYYRLLGILTDPKHPEHEDMLTWVGGAYDADHFDVEDANRFLRGG